MPLPNINYTNHQAITALGFDNDFNTIVPSQSQADYAANGLAIARTEFEPQWNNVLSTLVNKIAKTIVNASIMNNPMAPFMRGNFGITGDTIEQIYVGLIEAQSYNPDYEVGSPYKTEKPDVESMFHRNPRREMFKTTVYRDDLGKAFRSENGIANLINRIVASLSESNIAAEYVWSKKTFDKYYNTPDVPLTADQIRTVPEPVDGETSETFLIALKRAIRDIKFNSTKFNPMKKPARTGTDNMALFVLADLMPTIEVKTLAGAFNAGQMSPDVPIIELDDFGGANDILGVLCDKEFFMIMNQMSRMETVYNPEKLYTNIFFHIWQQYSVSYFHNCIIFKK